MLEEANGSGAANTDYVYLGDQPIATFTPGSSSLTFIHADRLGTPQKATNSGQSVVWKADYQPFGDLNVATSQTATLAQSLRLPGQEFEGETGWHQNGFRDYAPSLGRYLESDPIGLAGGVNTFAYVRANPLKLTDPKGQLFSPAVVAAVGLGIVAAYLVEEQYYLTHPPNDSDGTSGVDISPIYPPLPTPNKCTPDNPYGAANIMAPNATGYRPSPSKKTMEIEEPEMDEFPKGPSLR